MKKEHLFSKYVMIYSEDIIENLKDNNGKNTLFSFSFYNQNKSFLDNFKNILSFVKPKKETTKNNNLIINLDDFNVRYQSNNEEIKEEDIKIAMNILKNVFSENNPVLNKKKALLIKYQNDVKMLKELEDENFTFAEEIEEIEIKIEEIKKEISDILNN